MKTASELDYSYRNVPKGPPGITSPSDGWYSVNCTYAFTKKCSAEEFGIQFRYIFGAEVRD